MLLERTVAYHKPQGGACSRNGAFASIRRPNRPQTTSSHQPTERLSPDTFDDLSHPSDTLLALSVRCVVKNIASPARPTCKAEARRRVHLEQLRHLPSDLSQRIFDELVRTRSLTKEVAANFRGCHLLDARLDAYPGLEDTWLEASWAGGGGVGGGSLFMLLPRFIAFSFLTPPHRFDVSS